MNFLIGVDDTDNLESRGTGHRVRQLANWLAENQLAHPTGITRHQLLTWFFYLILGPVMDFAFHYLLRFTDKFWFVVFRTDTSCLAHPAIKI